LILPTDSVTAQAVYVITPLAIALPISDQSKIWWSQVTGLHVLSFLAVNLREAVKGKKDTSRTPR
jgi:hypothetical protein